MGSGEGIYAGLSDAELLTKAKDGEIEAFNQMHRRYRERILNYVYRFVGKYEIAEDITQETFIRVYNNLANVRIENIAGWIYTIARNLTMNELRRIKQESNVSLYEVVCERDGEESLMIDYLVDNKGGETEAREKELEGRVQNAINALPVKYREVMILCGLQGLSYKEAARVLRCSLQSVGVRMFRARELMRKLYFGKKREIK